MEVAGRRRAGAGGLTLRMECPDVGGDLTSCVDPKRTFRMSAVVVSTLFLARDNGNDGGVLGKHL